MEISGVWGDECSLRLIFKVFPPPWTLYKELRPSMLTSLLMMKGLGSFVSNHFPSLITFFQAGDSIHYYCDQIGPLTVMSIYRLHFLRYIAGSPNKDTYIFAETNVYSWRICQKSVILGSADE